MRSIFYTLFISALVAVVSAFPNRSGTCFSNQTIIEQAVSMGKMDSTLGYNFQIKMTGNYYVPKGSPVQFSITGKTPFKGLLLYAVDSQKNHVGSWDTPTGFKILTCQGDPSGTLSHADPNPKGPSVKFMWTPPDSDRGPINFVGTVVVSTESGFQIVKIPTSFTVAGSKLSNPSAGAGDSTPTSSDPSNSSGTQATATRSDASSLTRSALLLQLTAVITLLFYYL
jgi:hypothetical protein